MTDLRNALNAKINEAGLSSLDWEHDHRHAGRAKAQLAFSVYLHARLDAEDESAQFTVHDLHEPIGDKGSNSGFDDALRFLGRNADEAKGHASDLAEAHELLASLLANKALVQS